MNQPTNDHRDDLIRGLRDLAEWLEANPDVPVGRYPTFTLLVHARHLDGIDGEEAAAVEVRRVADLMNMPAVPGDDDLSATKAFGDRVSYELLYIGAERRARYAAGSSYFGAVEPDMVGTS